MRKPFKMKSSPTKAKLDNFFKGLGKKGTEARQEKQVRKNQGMTDFEKRRAEKKSRKPGESKYQADIRRRGEKKAATQEGNRMNAENEVSRDAQTKNIKAELKKETKKKNTKKIVVKPNAGDSKSKSTKTKTKVVKTKNNTGPRVNKVKKNTIEQDVKPTPGPLDPKYMPKAGDPEMTLEDFKRITNQGQPGEFIGVDKSLDQLGKFIDPRTHFRKNLNKVKNSLFGSIFLKKSPSKKRGYKMKK